MHRFFISPEWIENRTVTLVDEVAHQIRAVLRMQPGRKIVVLDNGGYEHYVTLRHVAKNVVTGEIYDSRPVESEPRLQLTLYQGTLKAQKFEWVLQKGTELGVTEFVPTICERSVLSDVENVDRKLERWARIIKEAAEQAGRGLLPKLRSARMFQQACQQAGQRAGSTLIAWEAETNTDLKTALAATPTAPTEIGLFIGPEGGYTLDEVRLASGYGIIPVGLGKRILRAETAGLVGAAAIFYQFGDLA